MFSPAIVAAWAGPKAGETMAKNNGINQLYPPDENKSDHSKTISRKVARLIVDQSVLDRFRQKCTEYAHIHRRYNEAYQAWLFEDYAYINAIDDLPELQQRGKPDQKIRRKLRDYIKKLSNEITQHSGNRVFYDDFNRHYWSSNQLIDYLEKDSWGWEWHERPFPDKFEPIELFTAIQHFSELKKQWKTEEKKRIDAVPSNENRLKVLDYLRNLKDSKWEKNIEIVGYSYIGKGGWGDWEWCTFRYIKTNENRDKREGRYVLEGWVIPEIERTLCGRRPLFHSQKPNLKENPWPFQFEKQVREEETENYEAVRLMNPESENDRLAMYLLLALCHDEHDREPEILTPEIKSIVPDHKSLLRPEWPQNLDDDLKKTYGYIENDVEEGINSRNAPLPKTARLVYEKLKNLKPHEAMTGPDLLAWLSKEHDIEIDDKTLRKTYLEPIKPYGLENKAKVGYYIE